MTQTQKPTIISVSTISKIHSHFTVPYD